MKILRSKYLPAKQPRASKFMEGEAAWEPAELNQNVNYFIDTKDTPIITSIRNLPTINTNETRKTATAYNTINNHETLSDTGTNEECSDKTRTLHTEFKNLSITLCNIPNDIKVKVYIHPVDVGNVWLTRTYLRYENDLWFKTSRYPNMNRKEWIYNCMLCPRTFMKFESMKYHLNRHLNLYLFVCKVCGHRHTCRNAALKHLKRCHGIFKNYKAFIGN